MTAITLRVDAGGQALVNLTVAPAVVADHLETIHHIASRLGKRLVVGSAMSVPTVRCCSVDDVLAELRNL